MRRLSFAAVLLPVVLLAVVLAPVLGAVSAHAACGADDPCQVPLGEYFVAQGDEAAVPHGEAPVLLFFHGWGSSGRNVINNEGLIGPFLERGFTVLAPQGLVPEGRRNRSWAHQSSPSSARDESAFIKQVMQDFSQRFAIDNGRILVSGFSQGGSMAWHLACFDGQDYAAFAPVAGAFWRPHPAECPGGPVRLLHIHGLTDQVVPLEGRPIGDRWYQGDVFAALRMQRDIAACGHRPDRFFEHAEMNCRVFEGCSTGGDISLCLHSGQHSLPAGWQELAIDWFLSAS